MMIPLIKKPKQTSIQQVNITVKPNKVYFEIEDIIRSNYSYNGINYP